MEGTFDHRVLEVAWAVEGGDARRESRPYSEVPRFPGDLFAELDEAGHRPRDRALASLFHRLEMQVEIAAGVKASLHACANGGQDGDHGHRQRRSAPYRTAGLPAG